LDLLVQYEYIPLCISFNHSGEKGTVENRRSVSALSAGAYTTTFALDGRYSRGKEGGRAPPPPIPGWADFTIMMECTPEVAIASLFVLSSLRFLPFTVQIRLLGTPVSADLIHI
jgi:hypothetical protein